MLQGNICANKGRLINGTAYHKQHAVCNRGILAWIMQGDDDSVLILDKLQVGRLNNTRVQARVQARVQYEGTIRGYKRGD